MNIVLVGFMASGKTTVGVILAKKLNMEFVDSDLEIEKESNMCIPEIFEKNGEKYFRKIEKNIVKRISEKDNCVISTGGGVVLDKDNIKALRKNGVIINLETNPEIIAKRLAGDSGRPLANGSIDGIIDRFYARKPFYDDCDIKIILEKNKSAENITEEILTILEVKYEGKIWSSR